MFLFECWKQLVLGFIQGITEFLPISSTAHLKVVPILLGWGDPGVPVTAALQLGSILAVVLYFWEDLQKVLIGISSFLVLNNRELGTKSLSLSIFFGTLPILFSGMFIKLYWKGYESSELRNIPVIAAVSIFMAIILFIAERFGKQKRAFREISLADGFLVGIASFIIILNSRVNQFFDF